MLKKVSMGRAARSQILRWARQYVLSWDDLCRVQTANDLLRDDIIAGMDRAFERYNLRFRDGGLIASGLAEISGEILGRYLQESLSLQTALEPVDAIEAVVGGMEYDSSITPHVVVAKMSIAELAEEFAETENMASLSVIRDAWARGLVVIESRLKADVS